MTDGIFSTGEKPGRDEVRSALELPRIKAWRRPGMSELKQQAQARAINAEWTKRMAARWLAGQERNGQELRAAELADRLGLDVRQVDRDPGVTERARRAAEKPQVQEWMTWDEFDRYFPW